MTKDEAIELLYELLGSYVIYNPSCEDITKQTEAVTLAMNALKSTEGEWIRLDLAKKVIAKFEGYLDEDMIYRIQIALEKENEADMKGSAE